eukprot:2628752-Prymnesium_polylepis.1
MGTKLYSEKFPRVCLWRLPCGFGPRVCACITQLCVSPNSAARLSELSCVCISPNSAARLSETQPRPARLAEPAPEQ